MNLIDNLTGFADQQTNLLLPDGTTAQLRLIFCGATNRWYFNLVHPLKPNGINGVQLCCFPNILHQWDNILPFGIACVTADGTDPFNANDFATGRVKLYLLNEEDIDNIESVLFGVNA